MKRSLGVGLSVVAVASSLLLPMSAWSQDCSAAVDRFNATVRQFEWPMRQFANCLSYSKGRDDCANEFRHVRAAYDDYEAAVARFRRECK